MNGKEMVNVSIQEKINSLEKRAKTIHRII